MGKKSELLEILYPLVSDLVSKGVSITKACEESCEKLGVRYKDQIRRSISRKLESDNITDNRSDIEDTDVFKVAKEKQLDTTKQKFIISWCQSDTEIHYKFMDNIEAYAKEIDASIHIIAGRYKNPTSISSNEHIKKAEKNLKNTWHQRVIPYLDANRHNVHDYLCILSDVKIQPTASTPLSGMNSMTGLESCIVGHPRVHLKSLPVLDGYPSKLLISSGAVSVENYTDTKSGKKGEFHHTLGFVIVELDGDVFHVRQVQCDDDGSFYDLYYFVKDSNVFSNISNTIMVFGDLHLGETNDDCLKVSFDMADKLNSRTIILHDVFNGHSISHHERHQPFTLLDREMNGTDSLKDELFQMTKFFNIYKDYNFVMVRSNHDEFLDRWLNDVDWRKSANKYDYLSLANILANDTVGIGIIPALLRAHEISNVHCLGINDSYRAFDIELGMHGHIGSNGSRGGVIQFKNLNTKNVTGHTHSPCREDGHLSVGTLTHLRVGYNKGASSWMNSNVVIYPNGKCQHIHITKGKYTTIN